MSAWPFQTLASLGNIVTGSTPKTSEDSFFGGDIPFVTPSELGHSEPITVSSRTLSASGGDQVRLIPNGAVMVCCIGSLGKIGIAGRTLATNQQINSVIFNSELIVPRFGYYACRNIQSALNPIASNTTIPIVSKSKFQELQIPVPPLPEQRRIADILDRADALRAKRRATLARLDELTRAIFIEMFGDSERNPMGWSIKPMQEVVRPDTIITYGIVQAGDEFPGGIPYIRTGDIKEGEILVEDLRRTNPEIAEKFQRSRVETGDIVMSIRATVGTTALVPPEINGANLTQGTAKICPGPLINRIFFLSYLRSQTAQQWILRQVKGATFREITLGRLRELPVPVPPFDLQLKFANRLSQVTSIVAMQRRTAEQSNLLFASLQDRAFRGDL